MRPKLEICVETLRGAEVAARGGADRIELCGTLADGGISPSLGVLEQVLDAITIPVHSMIRPRGGDFCYSNGELRAMERDIRDARAAGATAVVVGVITSRGEIDVDATRRLVEMARPMRVTFHRAFDVTRDHQRALEDVIASGADILLTSGGARRLSEATSAVAELVERAAGRIEIMGGSGVAVESATELCKATGIAAIHGSFRRPLQHGTNGFGSTSAHLLPDALPAYELREEDVRTVAAALARAFAETVVPASR